MIPDLKGGINRTIGERTADLIQIISAIPVMAWCCSPDGSCDFLNKPWHDYTGMSPEEARGSGWANAIHPDDRPKVSETWMELLTTGAPGQVEGRYRRFDGIYHWFLIRANPLRDESGSIVKWYGTNTNIEDQKRIEEQLRRSEASAALERRFRSIVDGLPALVVLMSPDGELEHANRHALEYTGVTLEEMKAWARNEIIHPDELPGVISNWKASVETGQPYSFEARHRRADGVYRWFDVRGLPLRDVTGCIILWYLLLNDVDDRKRAEEQLRLSEAFLVEGQRLSKTGNFSWSPVTDAITSSDQFYRILEYEPNTRITFDHIRARLHPDEVAVLNASIGRARSQGGHFDREYRLQMPDGRTKHVHVTAHASRDRQGRPEFIGAAQDITQRKLSEEALNKARSELAHVWRVMSLGAFTASIAHEVNQPLFGILTNTNSCLRMLAADPPNIDGAREAAQLTLRDGSRASDVISRLRALFGKKAAVMESLNLNDAVREVVALSQSDVQRSRVVLQVDLSEDLQPITGDRIQLQQVILNLLRNAIDAMSNVDDRPRRLLISTSRDEGDHVRLSVKDAGVGLSPAEIDRLFEAFYTTKKSGMGIGLTVCRAIIESHNGRLWAAPNEGHGATFSFSIPRLQDPTP